MKLKLMTYNIAAGRNYSNYNEEGKTFIDIESSANFVKSEAPDVCGFNEVDRLTDRSGGLDEPKIIGDILGYTCIFGKTIALAPYDVAEYGNAFATRFPIIESEVIPIPLPAEPKAGAHYEQRSVIRAKVCVEGRNVTFIQTHFGLTPEEQDECVKLITSLIDAAGDEPVVFAGDLNVLPENPVLDPIRERLFDTGTLIDAPYKTYPTHNRESRFLKIDYIFLSHHFKPISARVPKINVSDHYPYIVEAEM